MRFKPVLMDNNHHDDFEFPLNGPISAFLKQRKVYLIFCRYSEGTPVQGLTLRAAHAHATVQSSCSPRGLHLITARLQRSAI